jgi:hypothetical protein
MLIFLCFFGFVAILLSLPSMEGLNGCDRIKYNLSQTDSQHQLSRSCHPVDAPLP